MQLFYGAINAGAALLDGDEARHATKVLRKQIGDTIHVLDGNGSLFTCEITEISKQQLLAQIVNEQPNFGSVPYDLHLAIAPTKNIDRMEWLLEKATEMGISAIHPFISTNSERRRIREDRLERILRSAAKQSLKGKLPHLYPLTSLELLLDQPFEGQKFIAHCHNSERKSFSKAIDIKQAIMILIGPEGDFTLEEVELAENKNFEPVSLGASRLRTETAGLAAVSAVYHAASDH